MSAILAAHQHGKGRVRLGRVWREGNTHYMVEWTVFCMLESDMAHAFIDGSNADMTATDTQKNTVRVLAANARLVELGIVHAKPLPRLSAGVPGC